MRPSGRDWVALFPCSVETKDLSDGFRPGVEKFVGMLRAHGAHVVISTTYRPPERAYLMHWAWQIARLGFDPSDVPPMKGVEIIWDHDGAGDAAEAMVEGYGMAVMAVLSSEHTQRDAIDMTITWQTDVLVIRDIHGNGVTLSGPKNGGENERLWDIGRGYGLIKLVSDHPHWSLNGH